MKRPLINRSWLLLPVWVMLAACVSTQLNTSTREAGDPAAPTAPLPRSGQALSSRFDAKASAAREPSSAGAQHDAGSHSGHSMSGETSSPETHAGSASDHESPPSPKQEDDEQEEKR